MTGCEPSALQQRLRKAGIPLLSCSESGELLSVPQFNEDWLGALLCASPLFLRELAGAAKRWSQEIEPSSVEVLRGVWLAPSPMMQRRRRAEAQTVAVIVTDELIQSEQLAAICQGAQQDLHLIRSMLAQLPPASAADVPRLLQLVRHLQEDNAHIVANDLTIENTGQQLAESYEEISLLYTIIQSMTVVEQPERFVTIACRELLNTLPYAWIGARLVDDVQHLKTLAGRFIVAGRPSVGNARLSELAQDLLALAKPDVPIVLEPQAKTEHARFAALGSTVLVHPVTSDGRILGLLIAGDKQGSDTAASSVDIKLLGATATHMSIFLENAALYDDLNAMFLGTLEALTASIDAKDRYTCGHSQRVALLTQQLATAAGLEESVVRRMHIAGLVHDVGKIGVPESVLLKPGKLTKEEFEWVARHPEMGYRILKDIPQLKDILPGVLHHHERYDGRGYPRGLAGKEIPQVARLIGLADAFDAMSSTRTYRSAMERPQVLREIMQCSGAQFDPELAPLFVNLDFTEYDRLVAEHQAGEGAVAQGRLPVGLGQTASVGGRHSRRAGTGDREAA